MTNEPYTEETAGQIDPQNPFENALKTPHTGRITGGFCRRSCCRIFISRCFRNGRSVPAFAAR
ncbi:MAG: hypothetical protein ACLSFT_05015 [Ruminococcus callidus]